MMNMEKGDQACISEGFLEEKVDLENEEAMKKWMVKGEHFF